MLIQDQDCNIPPLDVKDTAVGITVLTILGAIVNLFFDNDNGNDNDGECWRTVLKLYDNTIDTINSKMILIDFDMMILT